MKKRVVKKAVKGERKIQSKMEREVKKKLEIKDRCECNCTHRKRSNDGFGMGYFLGFIGSAVYYISIAESFGQGFIGFLKAIVWPAFLVFDLLKFIGA